MNSKVLFAALFIAMLATTVAYVSPAAANVESSSAPQRNMAPLVIAPSMQYEVNGSLAAWVNASGHILASVTIDGSESHSVNITIRQLYLGVKITLICTNITVDSITGEGSALVRLAASISGAINIYVKVDSNETILTATVDKSDDYYWNAKWFVPWGSTKNFTVPFPMMGSDDMDNSTASPDPFGIKFTSANITSDSVQYTTVRHVSWNFDDWMRDKVNTTLNNLLGPYKTLIAGYVPGIQTGFSVPLSVGRVDLWTANATADATPVQNVLLMAGALINLLVKWNLAGSGNIGFTSYGHTLSGTYDVNLGAEFGMNFALSVTSDYFRTHNLVGDNQINTFAVLIPEGTTFVWRKVGVIVYFGSPAHGIDVTGGTSWGSTAYGGQVLFFVDYGWDGTPDFGTNGTGQPAQIAHPAASVSGTGTTRTVNLNKASGGNWIYFNLDISGYDIKNVKKDGVALNATQYWVFTDELGNRMLYVCDDPAYSYTVELTSLTPGGLPMPLLIIGALAVVVVVAGLLVLTRRKSSSKVSIK